MRRNSRMVRLNNPDCAHSRTCHLIRITFDNSIETSNRYRNCLTLANFSSGLRGRVSNLSAKLMPTRRPDNHTTASHRGRFWHQATARQVPIPVAFGGEADMVQTPQFVVLGPKRHFATVKCRSAKGPLAHLRCDVCLFSTPA